jgi:aspartyl-tRNA synthetase
MHAYRTHTCGQLRKSDVGQTVRLSGWVHRRRDHGGLIFIDLRDHYGITQCVIEPDGKVFPTVDTARSEWVLTLTGKVVARLEDTVNTDLATGEVEMRIEDVTVQSQAQELPLPVFGDMDYPEETRLTYRFLDLRRERLHKNIMLRSNIIRSLRNRVRAEFQRIPDPDPDCVVAGRRARLPGAVAPLSRRILRAAPGAAAIQTVDSSRRL